MRPRPLTREWPPGRAYVWVSAGVLACASCSRRSDPPIVDDPVDAGSPEVHDLAPRAPSPPSYRSVTRFINETPTARRCVDLSALVKSDSLFRVKVTRGRVVLQRMCGLEPALNRDCLARILEEQVDAPRWDRSHFVLTARVVDGERLPFAHTDPSEAILENCGPIQP